MASVNFILQLPMTVYKYKWYFCGCFRLVYLEIRLWDDYVRHLLGDALRSPTLKRSWMQTQPVPSWALQVGRLLRAVLSWGKRARPLYAPASTNPWTRAASRKGHGDGWGGFRMKVIPRGIFQLKARSQRHSSKSFSLDR